MDCAAVEPLAVGAFDVEALAAEHGLVGRAVPVRALFLRALDLYV